MNKTIPNKEFHPHLVEALEHTNQAIEITDVDGVTQCVTSPFEGITGYKCTNAVGHIPRFLKKENIGSREYAKMWKILLAGKVYKKVFQNRKKEGGVYYEEETVAPIKDNNGKITHFACIRKDATKSILLQQTLQKRNQELETFLYKTSHDLKSPTSTIKGLINLIKSARKQDELLKYCKFMEDTIEKMDNVLSDLTEVSRIYNRETNLSLIDFRKTITQELNRIKRSRPADTIDVIIDVKKTRPFHSDSLLLSSVFYHLLDNTIVFANSVQLKDSQSKRGNCQVSIVVRDCGEGVEIEISDSGCGIDSEILEKIFGMFYKGNLNSKGAGLGLYVVKEAVEHLNGRIKFQSNNGKGTKVLLYIPNLKNRQ